MYHYGKTNFPKVIDDFNVFNQNIKRNFIRFDNLFQVQMEEKYLSISITLLLNIKKILLLWE